jgi:hypothetical protein
MFSWKYLVIGTFRGDVFLENRTSRFLNFSKKCKVSYSFNFGTENNKTNVFTSAALVRGQYAKVVLQLRAIKVLIN